MTLTTETTPWPPVEDTPEGPLVRTRVESGVGYAVLHRPAKRNALDAATRAALTEVLESWRDEPAVRVVVLSGVGKSFAAGADLRELLERSPDQQREFVSPPHIYDAVADFPRPVIACVNGHALGAGCELMMACDMRIAGSRSKMGQPEATLGIIPGGGGTQRLPRLVGFGRAMRMVLSGEVVDAHEAHRIGLVEEVVEQDELHEHVRLFAEKMAKQSPVALGHAKRAVQAAWDLPLADGLRREIDIFMEAFVSDDAREGITAFLERRPPEYGAP